MSDDYFDHNRHAMSKALKEMTPERRKAVEEVFSKARNSGDDFEIQPPMRMMNFGGDYTFDENRKQVDLEGTFSKEDLLRIAMVMI